MIKSPAAPGQPSGQHNPSAIMNNHKKTEPPLTANKMATLSQSIAFVLVYRRAFLSALVLPTTVLSFPLLVALLNLMTRDLGLVTLLLSIAFYQVLTGMLVKYLTQTTTAYEKVLARQEGRYVLQATLASLLVVRLVILPICKALGLSLSYILPLGVWFQFALALVVLEALVLCRYFGPHSIMRCSSFPLVSNPFESFLRHLFRLDFAKLLGPSETSGEIFAPQPFTTPNPEKTTHRRGRRFQHPSFVSTAAQMVVAIMAAVIVCYVFVNRFFNPYDQFAACCAWTGCAATTLLSVVPFARQCRHELDPQLYVRQEFRLGWVKWAIVTAIVAEGFAFLTAFVGVGHLPPRWISLAVNLFFPLLLLNMTIPLFDEIFKLFLFFESDFDEDAKITLQCLLESSSIAQKVLTNESQKEQGGTMQAQETRRMDSLAREMGNYMTSKVEDRTEAPLEEDILRFSVLQSLGGGGDNDGNAVDIKIPKRQKEQIQKHINVYRCVGSASGEPDVVALVRGLCVWVGGLGEALQIASDKRRRLRFEEFWEIPPAALVEANLALQAIQRCFALASEHPSNKSTALLLTTLVPGTLSCMYRLRAGICQVACGTHEDTLQYDPKLLSESPLLEKLLKECDQAAAVIMCTKPSAPEQIHLLPVDRIVVQWVQQSLAARTPSSTSN